VEARIAAFGDDPTGPSWTAALDRILVAWIEAGELDGADRALDNMAAVIKRAAAPTSLGVGTYHLMRARVAAARGNQASAVTSATEALARFAMSDAPWWKAKAIRVLERVGAANRELVTEVERIERLLGARSATT
jgi:hypothetical protein